MYCLSKDGLRITEATGFMIERRCAPTRYIKDGEVVFNAPGTNIYCLYTNNGYLMDVFESEVEAKERIKEVMQSLAAGIESFEF